MDSGSTQRKDSAMGRYGYNFKGSRIGACCRDCQDRYPACHDKCEKYKEAYTEWIAYKEKIKEARKPSEADKYKFQSIDRMRKRRKWHDGKS